MSAHAAVAGHRPPPPRPDVTTAPVRESAALPRRLCCSLVEHGLADLPLLQRDGAQARLVTLRLDEGAVRADDTELLTGIAGVTVGPCWDIGIVGAVCLPPGEECAGPVFLGVDHCRVPVDLSRTRHDLLRVTRSIAGDCPLDYRGSVHAAFGALLDAHLLPVLLPLVIATDLGVAGLAVCDFRFASAPIAVTLRVHERVRQAVDAALGAALEDVELSAVEFADLFGTYVGASAVA